MISLSLMTICHPRESGDPLVNRVNSGCCATLRQGVTGRPAFRHPASAGIRNILLLTVVRCYEGKGGSRGRPSSGQDVRMPPATGCRHNGGPSYSPPPRQGLRPWTPRANSPIRLRRNLLIALIRFVRMKVGLINPAFMRTFQWLLVHLLITPVSRLFQQDALL